MKNAGTCKSIHDRKGFFLQTANEGGLEAQHRILAVSSQKSACNASMHHEVERSDLLGSLRPHGTQWKLGIEGVVVSHGLFQVDVHLQHRLCMRPIAVGTYVVGHMIDEDVGPTLLEDQY